MRLAQRGEITEKERQILGRMANRFGILETRVKELEGSMRIKKQY